MPGYNSLESSRLPQRIEGYIRHLQNKGLSPETIRRYRIYFNKFTDWLGHDDFTEEAVKEYAQFLVDSYKPASASSIFSQIANFCDYLFEYGVTNRDFALHAKHLLPGHLWTPGQTDLDAIGLMYEAAQAMYEDMEDEISLRAFATCELLYRFGLRVSELINLTTRDVYSDGLHVRHEGVVRILPFECKMPALDAVLKQDVTHGYLFRNPSSGKAISVSTIRADLKLIDDRCAYLGKFTASHFRQAKFKELVLLDWPYYRIAEYMGASVPTVQAYIQTYRSEEVG